MVVCGDSLRRKVKLKMLNLCNRKRRTWKHQTERRLNRASVAIMPSASNIEFKQRVGRKVSCGRCDGEERIFKFER